MNKHIFLVILIGSLSAFPPFVTDLYLPSLPSLAAFFKTSPSLVQMSLTMSMLGLALGQLFVGPLSDKYGRRHLLLISLIAFILSTILCLLSPNVIVFNAFRLVQGMAASGGIVIARAMAADKCRGKVLTKFLALVSAINGIAPVTAPVLGGILLNFVDWRGTFALLLIYGFALLFGAARTEESLPENRRNSNSMFSTFKSYGSIFKNSTYSTTLILYAASCLVLFAYISASPFILQQGYGLSPMAFSFCFAVNAISIGIGCAVAGRAKERSMILLGSICLFIFAGICAAALALQAPIFVIEATFICMLFSFGLLQPPVTAIALNAERKNAGAASALLGASGFLMGGIVTPLVGIGNIFHSLGIALVCGGILALLFSFFVLKKIGKK